MGYSSGQITEIGEVRTFRFAPSSGAWLPLEGGTFNVDDYPGLGALYGGSPGVTFTIDDFRGKAVYAADATDVAGTTAGTDSFDLSHTHGMAHTHQIDPPPTESSPTGSQAVGLLGLLSNASPPNDTVEVDIPEFTSGVSSVVDTGSSLTTVDKRPARGYLRLYIRAL